MKYRLLGNSGLRVSEAALGAMTFGEEWGWGSVKDEARKVYDAFREAGGNFIDTANFYTNGTSESFLGEFMKDHRQSVVLATKYTNASPGNDPNAAGNHRKSMMQAIEASLKRLRLERIDLYQFHRIDPQVPLEESLGEFARLQKEGKIRHVGVSNFNVEELARARKVVTVVSVQNHYNVADRASEDVLAVCARDGLAFIPWAPIARGSSDRLERDASGERLEALAKARGVSVLQLALAWLLAKSPAMLPIPGTSSVEHLNENVAAAQLKLTPAEMTLIG